MSQLLLPLCIVGLGAVAIWVILLREIRALAPDAPLEPPVRFPNRPDEPLLGCPTCRTPMHLIGRNTRKGEPHSYLWACENDHGWCRSGDSPADARFAWSRCDAAKMMEIYFG